MVGVAVVALWAGIGIIGLLLFQAASRRELGRERFGEGFPAAPRADSTSGRTDRGDRGEGTDDQLAFARSRRVARRWFWLPWLIAVALAATVLILTEWPVQYVLAAALVVGLLLGQLESFLYTRHISRLERQLADAIDIMVGAVGAGSAVGPALDAARTESDRPLEPYLTEISGRIRLGDDPRLVFRSLADRVPLETFLLFSSALAVHYEVGGRLAPTLATVGRTIRDRIEITRRIQSNIAQSQFSTFAIIGLVYLIAVIVWRNGPEAMGDFLSSTVGSWFVAGSVVLQAVGIVWMNLISKPRF